MNKIILCVKSHLALKKVVLIPKVKNVDTSQLLQTTFKIFLANYRTLVKNNNKF